MTNRPLLQSTATKQLQQRTSEGVQQEFISIKTSIAMMSTARGSYARHSGLRDMTKSRTPAFRRRLVSRTMRQCLTQLLTCLIRDWRLFGNA